MASRKVRHGVKYALLGLLLQDGRLYGYRLAQRIEALLGDAAAISPGLVYTSLDALERDGLIEEVGVQRGSGKRSARVLYAVTESGVDVLAEWFQDHYKEPIRWDPPAKLALLRPDQTEEMRVRIETALAECTDLLERVGDRVEEVAEHPWHGPFVRYAHQYGAGQLHSRIEWLQGALLLIEDQEKALTSGEL